MARIAIFDSGVGGLSIFQEIAQRLPDSQYIFVSDNHAFPYGTKPEDQLKERVIAVVQRLIQQFDPDLLVIACNTASTVVLPLLREKYNLPIVGVVPAIKPAAKMTNTNVIGLLATPATIKRDYTSQLIADFAANCEVIKVGSSQLVQIAEDKLYGKVICQHEIAAQIKPFLDNQNIDVIVLACTHFPLLNKEINKAINLNSSVKLIDSGKGIANRVSQLINGMPLTKNLDEPSVAVFTDLDNMQSDFKNYLQAIGFNNTYLLE